MSDAIEKIQQYIQEGRLNFTGQLIVDGEFIENPFSQIQPNKYGFYGVPDENGCRKNIHIDEIIEKYRNSKDKHEVRASLDAPELFLFWDAQTDSIIRGKELETIYRKNHNRGLMFREIRPLQDAKGAETYDDSWFISMGNANFPGAFRDSIVNHVISEMKRYMTYWLNKRAEHYARDGKGIYDR